MAGRATRYLLSSELYFLRKDGRSWRFQASVRNLWSARGLCGSPSARYLWLSNFGAVESGRSCPHCLHLRPNYGVGRTACLFQGPVRALFHALKYEQAEYLVGDLLILAEQSPGYIDHLRGAILVPVPLHRLKLMERGYNQSELVARKLSAPRGSSIRMENLLERVVDTSSQALYSRKDHQTNLKMLLHWLRML